MHVLGLTALRQNFVGNGARACAAYLSDLFPQFGDFGLRVQLGVLPLKKYAAVSFFSDVASAKLNKEYQIRDGKSQRILLCRGFGTASHL